MMPQIGDIELRGVKERTRKSGVKRSRFIYQACKDCGKGRWIFLWASRKGLYPYCQPCSVKHSDFNINSIHWGKSNNNWKGGRRQRKGGYVDIRIYPNDALFAMAHKGYILEHRYVMAKALGRVLDVKEFVHHKDGNTGNNHLDNLELCSANNHKLSYREGYKRGFEDGVKYNQNIQ